MAGFPVAVDLTVLTTDYGDGGVERMLVNTINGLSGAGVRIDYLVSGADGPYLDALAPAVRVLELGDRPKRALRSLESYLREQAPPRLITAKLRDDALAVQARRRAGAATRLYFRVGNPLGYRLRQRTRNPVKRWWGLSRLRRLYAHADGFIAVSPGIADDLVAAIGVPRPRIHVLPNPVVTDSLRESARATPDHPWLQETSRFPVIVGVGGLRQQKDFPTLMRAFALLHETRPCRLIILGQGRHRRRLLEQAARLGVSDACLLPGWVANPHAWMARASVFALSSRWEGFGNVLVEAAALGIPLVSTDCESGPRHILQDGRYGELVPVGDSDAMASALAKVLDNPPPSEWVCKAAEPYTVERSTRAYLAALGLSSVRAQAP